jgi:FAD/FMN-containing dehydrogenase
MNSALETLRRDFGGHIIEPGGAGYESASSTVLFPGSPGYILRPETIRDVQAAVRFAASSGLLLSVRGGGHSFAGFGTNHGGVVIDLSKLAHVKIIDKEGHIVRIGGGATWGQVAQALAPDGLAISSGDTKSVGVGGLTLNGGIGWKVRKYGLALDNVLAAEMVTADGQVVHASAQENPELFWAIRGGGGNFGIVTAFEFAAHQTTDVFFGTIAFPASQAAAVLQGWADYMRTAPEELTSIAGFANPLAGGPDAPVEIRVAFDGDNAQLAARAINPIRRLGSVISDDVALQHYADVLDEGGAPPPGIQFAVRSAFVEKESVHDVVGILAEARASGQPPVIVVRSVGGAVSRIPDDTTAYAHRRAELLVVTIAVGPRPAVQAARSTLDTIWRKLAAHVNGAYANFLTSAGKEDAAAIYPPRIYHRLAAVKHQYDPCNLFAHNHNVRPCDSDHSTHTQSIESHIDTPAILTLLADPSRIPEWAPAFADRITGNAKSGWRALKSGQDFALRVTIKEDAGTVDYLREITPGRETGAYLRVIPLPSDGSVVIMTVPVIPSAEPAILAATVREELNTLVSLASR